MNKQGSQVQECSPVVNVPYELNILQAVEEDDDIQIGVQH